MSQNPLVITQEEFESFLTILKNRTGIVPRASHRDGIKAYIEKKIAEKKLSVITFKNELLVNEGLFTELVNESTVNETYFFREERQFALLRDKIFPSWKKDFAPARIKIWSAACSYGEEAYSLALLAKAAGLNASVLASDINSIVLNHCKKGIFSGSSIRPVDGLAFQDLLLPYRKDDMSIEFDEQIKACIKTQNQPFDNGLARDQPFFTEESEHHFFKECVYIFQSGAQGKDFAYDSRKMPCRRRPPLRFNE